MQAPRGHRFLALFSALLVALGLAMVAAPATASVHRSTAPTRVTAGHHTAAASPTARSAHAAHHHDAPIFGLDAALPPAQLPSGPDGATPLAATAAATPGLPLTVPNHDGRAPPTF